MNDTGRHRIPTSFFAGALFTLFILFGQALNAQIQPGDSIPADSVPAIQNVLKGKGVIAEDTTNLPVKPAVEEKAVKNLEGKKEADNAVKKTPTENDSKKDTLRPHSPKLAMGFSAVLPGLGQIYNRKYWKLPIVYVGLGVCGYFIWTETSLYSKYKETYKFRAGVDSSATDWFPNETLNTVKEMKEYHHRNVEISYIAAGVIYLLNIVDAAVDAHLYDFDVSDDLSMRIEPSVLSFRSAYGKQNTAGLSLTLKF